jgi:hypothetical protein
LAERGVKPRWLFDHAIARVLQESVESLPRLKLGKHLCSHRAFIGQKAQKTELGKPAKAGYGLVV